MNVQSVEPAWPFVESVSVPSDSQWSMVSLSGTPVVTPDADTLRIVDRAYILHEGQVLMEGTPDAIVSNADVRRVYLGERFSL